MGVFAEQLYILYDFGYVAYLLSFVGFLIYMYSQNIISFLKFPNSEFRKIFSKNNLGVNKKTKIRKDPIINNITSNSSKEVSDLNQGYEIDETDKKISYLSPSLEILESNNISTKKNLDKENIKAKSDLLEKVFLDFNIEIRVINVKHGPVVTLFEILPAAGIKINTIINLADDISRSMGVGAVRIAQIYGTQYLGVEVPNEQREAVTIKELLSDENFKYFIKNTYVLVKIYLNIEVMI